ncbi:MAG: CopG family transcriptional regulator, partial [Candidatus Schekmanbacteria bacterium RBG_13_48_7]
MSKTVTLRLKDDIYTFFCHLAESENRSLSNFIETSVLRYLENNQYIDDYEMNEIKSNVELNKS